MKLLILKYLCVKLCNTVYRVACNDSHICHLDLSVIEDCHLSHLVLIARISLINLHHKSSVYLVNNLVYTWKQSLEYLDWPLLKCLSHDCMVSVGYTSCSDIPCIIPWQMLLVNKDSHKLCNCNCRVCIVHLENSFIWEIF